MKDEQATPGRSTVVVGIDGSDASRHALEWTLDKTESLGRVVPVTTFLAGPFVYGFGTMSGVDPEGQPYRDEAAARQHSIIDATDPSLRERAEVVERRAGPGLVEAATDADLLVVGSRGRGVIASAVLGSVASYCVKHSRVPVTVIPPDASTNKPLSHVVVGVDGSPHARAALRWAIDHTEPAGTIVAMGVHAPDGHGSAEAERWIAQRIQQTLDEAVAGRADGGSESPTVEIVIMAGDPRTELREAAHGADLLVIGARGRGSISYLLLGSVSTALTHHPTVATVVVPVDERRGMIGP